MTGERTTKMILNWKREGNLEHVEWMGWNKYDTERINGEGSYGQGPVEAQDLLREKEDYWLMDYLVTVMIIILVMIIIVIIIIITLLFLFDLCIKTLMIILSENR